MGSIKEKRRTDIGYLAAAALLGLLLLAFFVFTARLGFNGPDEGFYYTIPLRLLHGERLFAEEWSVTQLSSLFSVIPVWFYTRVTGGTEGLILFMRYLFIASDMLFYVYVCVKLRSYKLWGLMGAFLFCAFVPEAFYAFGYHAVSTGAMLLVCLILLTGQEEKKAASLIFAGIGFACAVLAEPLLIGLYAVYLAAAAVWFLRRKKRDLPGPADGLLCTRTWFFCTLGAFLVFTAFMALLLFTGSLPQLRRTLPYLFTGDDFGVSTLFDVSDYLNMLRLFGPVGLAGLLGCAAAAFAKKQKTLKFKTGVFLLSAVCFCGCCVCAWKQVLSSDTKLTLMQFGLYFGVLVLIAFPSWYFLCENRDVRLFRFWLAAVLFSVFVDTSSNVMLGSGGRIALAAAPPLLGALLRELTEAFSALQRKRDVFHTKRVPAKKLFRAGAAVFTVCFLLWHGSYILMEGLYPLVEKPDYSFTERVCTVTLDTGPYKNIKTSPEIADIYGRTLRDMETIVREADGAPLYVGMLAPYLYLSANLPCGDFSVWDVDETPGRRAVYWALFPAQKPGYIYLPDARVTALRAEMIGEDYLLAQMREINEIFTFETVRGEGGYILRVTGDA